MMLAAAGTAFGSEIDDPVGSLDHIEVVFDHDHGVAVVAQPVQYLAAAGSMSWKCSRWSAHREYTSVRPVSRLEFE
jgi:hypothetical protein